MLPQEGPLVQMAIFTNFSHTFVRSVKGAFPGTQKRRQTACKGLPPQEDLNF